MDSSALPAELDADAATLEAEFETEARDPATSDETEDRELATEEGTNELDVCAKAGKASERVRMKLKSMLTIDGGWATLSPDQRALIRIRFCAG